LGDVHIRPASRVDVPQICRLLIQSELPTIGVEECVENFVVAQDKNGSLVGVAGLEVYGENGLLRSVAVDLPFRGKGHGRALVDAVLQNGKAKGLRRIYLLTDTAQAYFNGLGFQDVGRELVDEAVKASPEFTECCETAAVMQKMVD
jgi:amino-acid N-acetyltransferase